VYKRQYVSCVLCALDISLLPLSSAPFEDTISCLPADPNDY